MDIAGALLHRLEEERVDPPDDRRLVIGVEDVANPALVDLLLVTLELAAAGLALVDAVDRVLDLLARSDARLDGLAEEDTQLVEGDRVERVTDEAEDGEVVLVRDEDLVRLREADREARRQGGRDALRLGPVDVRQLGLVRERLGDRRLVHDVAIDEQIDEVDPLLTLDGVQRLEALGRNACATVQDLAEEPLLHGYLSILSMFLTAGFTLTGGATPGPWAPPGGAVGLAEGGLAPPVDGRMFWGISSGGCGSWVFGVFGRAISSSRLRSSSLR